MHLIYLLLTVALIWLNLAGLTLLFSRWLPHALARAIGVLAVTLIPFALEHFIGLGKLTAVWPITSAMSLGLLYLQRAELKSFWCSETVFGLAFLYAFAWRFAFPNIDSMSEHLTDLYFISNYLGGDTLPPPDRWLAGGSFDFYYSFQHYAAALMGRIFNLEAGLTMNLAWCVLMALITSLAWFVASRFIQSRVAKILLVATLLLGGNGLSPLMGFLINEPTPTMDSRQFAAVNKIWASVRFSGMYDERVNTPLGLQLYARPTYITPGNEPRDLPVESIAYLTYLGDYHPPLGGFFLLMLTLALAVAQRKRQDEQMDSVAQQTDEVASSNPDESASNESVAPAVESTSTNQPALVCAANSPCDQLITALMGATPFVMLATNAWTFPVQCVLLAGWLLYRQNSGGVQWRALIAGAFTSLALVYPFLTHFASSALPTPIGWVQAADHTPIAVFLGLHWPILILMALGLWVGRKEKWVWWLTLTLAAILLMSELIYVDDPMGGKYNRFNTVLKWWSWLWPAVIIGVGSMVYGLGNKVLRGVVLAVCVALLSYAVPMGTYFVLSHKPDMGKMVGNNWLKNDDAHRNIINQLKNSPDGVVLEGIAAGAYSHATSFALNAGKPSLMGWPDHVGQWHNNPDTIRIRADQQRAFYRGALPDPMAWLAQYKVRYIVWNNFDQQRETAGTRAMINSQIARDYHWRPFHQAGDVELGYWERRDNRESNAGVQAP